MLVLHPVGSLSCNSKLLDRLVWEHTLVSGCKAALATLIVTRRMESVRRWLFRGMPMWVSGHQLVVRCNIAEGPMLE